MIPLFGLLLKADFGNLGTIWIVHVPSSLPQHDPMSFGAQFFLGMYCAIAASSLILPHDRVGKFAATLGWLTMPFVVMVLCGVIGHSF